MGEQVKYSVFIAEDMLPARNLLARYLEARPEFELSGAAKNGHEAGEMLKSAKYDLLLLDIHLPVMSGIEVLDSLDYSPYVIFTTAYDQYAIKAFDIGAIDYLLKPISQDRFDRALDRFLAVTRKETDSGPIPLKDFSLTFRENRKVCIVSYDSILYFSSHGKHTIVHTEEKDFEASNIIKEIEEKIPAKIFIRIHKQFIINLNYVSQVKHHKSGQYFVVIKDNDDSVIPIGRSYLDSLKSRLRLK